MDVWFEREVMPRMKGSSFLIRYADDLIIGFKIAKYFTKWYRVNRR